MRTLKQILEGIPSDHWSNKPMGGSHKGPVSPQSKQHDYNKMSPGELHNKYNDFVSGQYFSGKHEPEIDKLEQHVDDRFGGEALYHLKSGTIARSLIGNDGAPLSEYYEHHDKHFHKITKGTKRCANQMADWTP